jgi:hypothetical protein
MKHSKSLFRIAATAILAIAMFGAATARPAQVSDNLYNYLQLLRSDFNSVKVDLVNKIMKLSKDDAKKFWPIYREYENELGNQSISRAELVTDFVQSHRDGSFNDAKAKDMAKRWFKSQRARLDLLEKYHGKIQKTLTPVQAAQFLQIENQLGIFIDMTIASEMPTVGDVKKSP